METSVFPSTDAEVLSWSRAMARRLGGGSREIDASLAGAFIATQARFEAARAAAVRKPASSAARAEAHDARESMQSVARAMTASARIDPAATIARLAA